MDYSNEISQYKNFCVKSFPNFNGLQFLNKKKTISKVFQMINLFQILNDYDITDNKNLSDLSEMCINTLYDFLISIPTGNDLFISACTRQLSEELLEIVYTEFYNKDIELNELLKLNYRKLWQDGIKSTQRYMALSKQKKNNKKVLQEKTKLDNINNIFKLDSDKLHFKHQDLSSTQYLEQIIYSGTEFNPKTLEQRINQLHCFCIDLLPLIINFNIEKASMNQKSEYFKLLNQLK